MSIASRTTSIEEHIEDDYNALERLGADLTGVNKNIENIASVVNDIYDKLPKVTGTGSNVSLTPTLKGALSINPLGNCEQDTYTGKNQFDEEYELGSIGSNGQLIPSTTGIRTKNYQKVLASTYYTITVPNEVTGIEIFYYNNDTFISKTSAGFVQDKTITFNTPSNCNQIKWRFNTDYTTLQNQTMLNVGNTAEPYEKYVGRYS